VAHEEKKEVRETDIKEGKQFEQLISAWSTYRRLTKSRNFLANTPIADPFSFVYLQALDLAKNLMYSSKDVEKSSIILAEFQDEEWFFVKAGLFLSALINNGKEENYTVHTRHLQCSFRNLGYRNRKNIVVEGDANVGAGECMEDGSIIVKGSSDGDVGRNMKGGNITIEGDAKDHVGNLLKGGVIVVKGDAGSWIGYRMEGGVTTIIGNAGYFVGQEMKGGEIHLYGKYKSIENVIHGKIFHKGKLIVDK